MSADIITKVSHSGRLGAYKKRRMRALDTKVDSYHQQIKPEVVDTIAVLTEFSGLDGAV